MDAMQDTLSRVLVMLESLPGNEIVQGRTAREAANSLRESMDRRARILADQVTNPGLGGRQVYSALSHDGTCA